MSNDNITNIGNSIGDTFEKEFNDSHGNCTQTENSAEETIVYKRPRGRPPKPAKMSAEEFEAIYGNARRETRYGNKSLSNDESCDRKRKQGGKYSSISESAGETNFAEKRSRGRPKLSISLTEFTGALSNKCVGNMITGNQPSRKRGRGRPPGSCNKKRKKFSESEGSTQNSLNTNESPTYGNDTEKVSLQKKRSVNDQSLASNSKRGRGRPPGAKNKPKTAQILPKVLKLKPKSSIHLGKETISILRKNKVEKLKQSHQHSNVRSIPKHRFDEAMSMLTNSEHPIWEERNISCNKSIHRHWEEYVTPSSDHNLRLKFARQFLLRRDWINLSKVLSISLQDVVSHYNAYFALFTKYAAVCLAHTDIQQFNKFLQFLLKIEDSGIVLKKCTQLSQNHTDDEEV